MEWTRGGLEAEGFTGFCPWTTLERSALPSGSGVYVVLRDLNEPANFMTTSSGGWFKGRDPSVSLEMLAAAWLDDAEILYIGKATSLKNRLWAYKRFGAGSPVSHWGGRYIWHLVSNDSLLVAWKPTPEEDPREVERQLIARFVATHGRRPFANLSD